MIRAVTHAAITAALVAFVCVAPGSAHKPITSPYTYNDDVLPILRDRCGKCHVSGGVAPMSLMTHADTVPWGESIRTEVLAGHMPPGGVDEAPARFRNAPGLSPREMNLLLTWVTGGTPIGSTDKAAPTVTRRRDWPLGTPDLTLPSPSDVLVAAGTHEQTSEFVVSTGLSERRWVRAVDLLPGTATMVRAATIAVRAPASSAGATVERTLALWLPGQDPFPLDAGLGFELPASAELVVRLLYRKTWEFERQALRDRSTVGIYFAPARATITPVHALSLTGTTTVSATDRVLFRRTMSEDARAIAVYPEAGLNSAAVRVVATRPDGSRADLIAFHPRPDWAQRYWFREPIRLPRGTVIEVTATRDDEAALLPLSLAPRTGAQASLASLRLTLDVAR